MPDTITAYAHQIVVLIQTVRQFVTWMAQGLKVPQKLKGVWLYMSNQTGLHTATTNTQSSAPQTSGPLAGEKLVSCVNVVLWEHRGSTVSWFRGRTLQCETFPIHTFFNLHNYLPVFSARVNTSAVKFAPSHQQVWLGSPNVLFVSGKARQQTVLHLVYEPHWWCLCVSPIAFHFKIKPQTTVDCVSTSVFQPPPPPPHPIKEFDCDVKSAQHGMMRHTIKSRNDPPKDCLHDKKNS